MSKPILPISLLHFIAGTSDDLGSLARQDPNAVKDTAVAESTQTVTATTFTAITSMTVTFGTHGGPIFMIANVRIDTMDLTGGNVGVLALFLDGADTSANDGHVIIRSNVGPDSWTIWDIKDAAPGTHTVEVRARNTVAAKSMSFTYGQREQLACFEVK